MRTKIALFIVIPAVVLTHSATARVEFSLFDRPGESFFKVRQDLPEKVAGKYYKTDVSCGIGIDFLLLDLSVTCRYPLSSSFSMMGSAISDTVPRWAIALANSCSASAMFAPLFKFKYGFDAHIF